MTFRSIGAIKNRNGSCSNWVFISRLRRLHSPSSPVALISLFLVALPPTKNPAVSGVLLNTRRCDRCPGGGGHCADLKRTATPPDVRKQYIIGRRAFQAIAERVAPIFNRSSPPTLVRAPPSYFLQMLPIISVRPFSASMNWPASHWTCSIVCLIRSPIS